MSIQTTANPATVSQEATNPALRVFQLADGSLGHLAETVNLFSGEVSFPLEVLSLQGRGGLTTGVVFLYASNVESEVRTWNREAPTGLIGLGWTLAYDLIVVDHHDSISPYGESYYLASSNGSRDRLHLIKRTEGVGGEPEWHFEPENYQFWKIVHYPRLERWRITDEDGNVRIYGADESSRQYGIKWGGAKGNWIDASARSGQHRFVRAWNLASMETIWGDSLSFTYDNDTVQIGGAQGLSFTRASYLREIAEADGRRVHFRYAEKLCTATIKEYDPPHRGNAGPGVETHQDRFETRYLDSIEVSNAGGQRLLLLGLMYTLERHTDSASADAAQLYKRYLRAITTINAEGVVQRGMRFEYHGRTASDPNTGALAQITYPEGGTTSFTYDRQDIAKTSLEHTLDPAVTGSGIPRIWFGPSYAVLLRYDASRGRALTLSVFEWNGRWISSQPLTTKLAGDLDLSSLMLSTDDDLFVLSFRTTRTQRGDEITTYAVTRRFGRLAEWDAVALDMPRVVRAGAGVQVSVGRGFVVAVAEDTRQVFRHVWDARFKCWRASHHNLVAGGDYRLAAHGDYYVLCRYDRHARAAELTIHNFDVATLTWFDRRLDGIGPIVWEDSLPALSWSVGPCLATCTYLVRRHNDDTVDYEVRSYQWNQEFEVGRPHVLRKTRVPLSAQVPAFVSFTTGSQVANLGDLARFEGQGWAQGQLGTFTSERDPVQLAYGDDLAIVSDEHRSRLMAYDAYAGRFVRLVDRYDDRGPRQPTIAGRYITIRDTIHHREPNGELRVLGKMPEGMTEVANLGRYIAFGVRDGVAYVWPTRNGILVGSPVKLQGRLFPADADGPGLALAGPAAFATFTGTSFDQPTSITLHRILEHRFTGPERALVVVAATMDDGLGDVVEHAYEYCGEGTTGPFGFSARFTEVKSAHGTSTTAQTPFGHTLSRFYDGRALPGDDPNAAVSYLGGRLRERLLHDSAGRLVERESNEWSVIRDLESAGEPGCSTPLIGAYVRAVRQEKRCYDPLLPDASLGFVTGLEYNAANGLTRRRFTRSRNASGAEELLEELTTYAYQQYPQLVALNMLAQVAKLEGRVNGACVRAEVTTWKREWSSEGGIREVWDRCRQLRALAADASLGPEHWANTALPAGAKWRLEHEILQRDTFGTPIESIDQDGVCHSSVLDQHGRLIVAQFSNTSVAAQQATYQGFERYERLSGWTLADSENKLRAALRTDDAHVGERCLELGSGIDTLARTLALRDEVGGTYVLSSWVKTPAGFVPEPNTAWTVSWGGQVHAKLEIAATEGAWSHVHVLVSIPGSQDPRDVVLALANTSGTAIRVDALRFSPIPASFQASIHEPDKLRPIAELSGTGATSRVIYDDFDEIVGVVQALDTVVELRANASSPELRGGSFDPARPNAMVLVRPQRWATWIAWRSGGAWRSSWQGATERWQADDGRLAHVAGQRDEIVFTALPAELETCGVSLRVHAQSAVVGDLGLALGSALTLYWSPVRAAWRLRDESSGQDTWAKPQLRGSLSHSKHAASLDANAASLELVNDFAIAGLALRADVQVSVLEAGARWRLEDDETKTIYYLVRDATDPGVIGVATLPTHWLLYVLGPDLVLFCDGDAVIEHHADADISGAPKLIATDAISFSDVCLFAEAHLQLTYRDGAGRKRQERVRGREQVLATATIYDPVGRAAIVGMGVHRPSSELHFDPNLATFDWSSMTISGQVADQNPAAGAYPYARTRFEDSPLGRVIERGQPGTEFAITNPSGGPNTTTYTYGINDGSFGLPAHEYERHSVVDPDGRTAVTVRDRRGQEVVSAIQTSASTWLVTRKHYDAGARLVRITTPGGAEDTFAYDFVGSTVEAERANEGKTRFMYDALGRLRFRMDARGAGSTPPYIQYIKLDALARIVERGGYAHAWDDALAGHVDDMAWPPATPSQVTTHDGLDRGDLFGVGRVTEQLDQHQAEGPGASDGFAVRRTLTYDVFGEVIKSTTRADAFANVDYELAYAYDNLGAVTEIAYPGADGKPSLRVGRVYDLMGRIAAIELDGVRVSSYEYGPQGPVRQVLEQQGTAVGTRTFAYNPPGWLARVQDPALDLTIEYVSGRYPDGAGYYAGCPARITTAARAGRPELVQRLHVDPRGHVTAVADAAGTASTISHDDNGNITALAGATMTHDQDRLHTRTLAGQTSAYTHDPAGRLTKVVTDNDSLEIGYDWLRDRPLRITSVKDGVSTKLTTRYGADDQRVYKAVEVAGQKLEKLYLRDLSGAPLVEVPGGGGAPIEFVSGPTGPLLTRVGGETYFICTDQVGSVRGLFDASGTLIGGYDYTVFGDELGAPLGTAPDRIGYRFANRERDETGLYDFFARLYDPRVGRFISPDPEHQFLSPYVYAANNPTYLIDPDGEEGFVAALLVLVKLVLAGMAIGGALGAAGGAVGGISAIVSDELSGMKAAGTFFGYTGLGLASGAIGGGLGGLTAGLTNGASIGVQIGVGLVVSTATGTVLGGAESAGQAAISGGDWLAEGGKGALIGGISSLVGGLVSAAPQAVHGLRHTGKTLHKLPTATSGPKTTSAARFIPRNRAVDGVFAIVGGVAGGLAGSAMQSALHGSDANDTLISLAQGLAFGSIGAAIQAAPSFIDHMKYRQVQIGAKTIRPEPRAIELRNIMITNATGTNGNAGN